MQTTQLADARLTAAQPGPPHPEISRRLGRRRAAVAVAGTVAAAGVAAVSTTPVLGLIMFNHNETEVRSPVRS